MARPVQQEEQGDGLKEKMISVNRVTNPQLRCFDSGG